MNTKLLKGILLYTLVVIGIVLIIGMLIFGIMFFVPSFKPFGIGAIWSRQKEINWGKNGQYIPFITSNADGSDLDLNSGTSAFYTSQKDASVKISTYDFNIISKDISVEIKANDQVKQGRVAFLNNTFGLYKGDYNLKVTYEDVVVNGKHVFTIKALQPEGFLSVKNSKVVLEVPTSFAYNFTITTEKGNVYINLDNNKPLYMESLHITTTEGDLKVGNVAQNKEGYTNSFGTFSGPFVQLSNFYAATNTGDLDFSSIENLAITDTATNTVISANKGNIRFHNIFSQMPISLDGDNIRLQADSIYAPHFSCVVANGFFNVGNIIIADAAQSKGYVMISTSNAEVNIDTIGGLSTTTSAIITTTYGNVNIKKEITGSAKVSSTHGDIKINSIQGNVSAQSKYGDININYQGSCSVYNDHGDINITYVRSTESADKFVDVTSLRGKVNINNQVYNLNVTGQRNASINVTFAKLFTSADGTTKTPTTHNITANGSSTINVNIPNLEYSAKFNYAPYSIDQTQAYNQNNIVCNLGNNKQFAYEGLQYPYDNVTNTNAPATFNIDARGNGSRVSLNTYNKNSLVPDSANVFTFGLYKMEGDQVGDQIHEFSYYKDDNIFAWRGDNFVTSKVKYSISDGLSWMADLYTLTYDVTDLGIAADAIYEIEFKSAALEFGRFVEDKDGKYFNNTDEGGPDYICGTSSEGDTKQYKFERFDMKTLYKPNQADSVIKLYAIDPNNGGQIAMVIVLTIKTQ